MPKTAILTGVLLAVLGPIFYFLGDAGHRSLTAFIPTPIGLLIAGAGAAALHPARRKAAMHAAAGLALFGWLGSLMGARKWPTLLAGGTVERPLAATEQLLLFLICTVFLFLCVKSFRDARKAA